MFSSLEELKMSSKVAIPICIATDSDVCSSLLIYPL